MSLIKSFSVLFLSITGLLVFSLSYSQWSSHSFPGYLHTLPKNPVVIIMMDGFSKEYLDQSDMPVLKDMMKKGLFKMVKDMMPSVTNCNNAAICTGTFPEENGIVGNSFYSYEDGKEELMEEAKLVLAPTIFTRALKYQDKSALFSSKLKTIHLLSTGADFSISPEMEDSEWTKIVGPSPDKYSAEVNYWTFHAAIHTMKTRPDIKIYYIHTTDFPMHMWTPDDPRSKAHLHTVDSLIGVVAKTLPKAAIFLTADHGMNHKNRVWDLTKALANRGLPIKLSICASKDQYPKHHLGFGGCAYVYLNKPSDTNQAKKIILSLKGVESVYTRKEAMKKLHERGDRIGDLMVFGDLLTALGEASKESDTLASTYRSHGSFHEQMVPLLIYNISHPPSSFFEYNKDLARWLY